MTKKIISVIGIRGYPSDFKGTSGVEVYVQEVINELIKNHKKNLLLFNLYTKKKYSSNLIRKNGVVLKPLSTLHSKVGESLWYAFSASLQACFDGSQTVWYQGTGIALFSFLPKLARKKIIVTVHGLDWQRQKWSPIERKLFLWSTFFVFSLQPVVASVSLEMKKQLKKLFNIESVVCLPGITLLPAKKLSSSISNSLRVKQASYLLTVSRIVPEKRIEWLIESFLLLKTRLSLVIVGSHGNLPAYEKNLKKKYQNNRIKWLGYVDNSTKKQLIANCRMFVLASVVEGGNPLSFLEALSAHKKCVVPTKSVTSNFSQLKNVFFFNQQSRNDLNRKMKLALNAKADKRVASTTLERKILEAYSWSKTSKIYQSLFLCN